MSGRTSVLRDTEIELTIVFLNALGERADPETGSIELSIFPPSFDPRVDDDPDNAWIAGITLTSGGTGPYADAEVCIERRSVGSYTYTFTVPSDAEIGTAFDQWQATVNGESLEETFTFSIVDGASIELGTTQLYNNNMVFIRLSGDIAATDGSTLGETFESYFTTTYDPLYTSLRRIRLDLGSIISNIPDDTINLAIFEASLEANAFTFVSPTGLTTSQMNFFVFARRQFVTCLAALILLGAVTSQGGVVGSKKKRLADLEITSSSGQGKLDDLIEKAEHCKVKWEATLSSAAEVGPGTSSRPSMVIKGTSDPDRPTIGRDYGNTQNDPYPAANGSYLTRWTRRWKRGYYPGNRWDSRWDD